MSIDFNLEGVYEHKVQTDVVFNLRCKQDGQPADVNYVIEAWLKGAKDNVRGEVNYTKGNYQLTFFPGLTGKFELHIKVGKNWLYKDGDVVVNIVDRLSTHYVDLIFEAQGPAIQGGQVGKTTYVQFITKNAEGELVDPEEVNSLEVRVGSGSNLKKIKPEKIMKGKFKAEFEVDTPGFYTIDLFYDDRSVLKEVPKPHFTTPASAKNTKATNLPKNMVTVGQTATFFIQARTKNDLNATSGGDEFEVACDGPAKVSDLTVHDGLDGKYTVTFTPPESGVFEFNISLNGEAIGNSPVKISATRR